ncbi:uncharacterized protein MELLADRAFT_96031 [Melampsora larici-populina 98AG31]|uniref:Uncharacterized protein n=1 Tax=Melampsora larici-populina (strain 98AG31 / pathotype 3-4-7) TaxID=747676 RepID=F4SAN2_MELLP|nr:uncharacterized protein MELLADRAFT_96031 [Melampsora larici-populina 98AG31]EGF98296.1 hypothetical protein MELLADRAFT_96031 [Melampsora larici-populina 98AG31]
MSSLKAFHPKLNRPSGWRLPAYQSTTSGDSPYPGLTSEQVPSSRPATTTGSELSFPPATTHLEQIRETRDALQALWLERPCRYDSYILPIPTLPNRRRNRGTHLGLSPLDTDDNFFLIFSFSSLLRFFGLFFTSFSSASSSEESDVTTSPFSSTGASRIPSPPPDPDWPLTSSSPTTSSSICPATTPSPLPSPWPSAGLWRAESLDSARLFLPSACSCSCAFASSAIFFSSALRIACNILSDFANRQRNCVVGCGDENFVHLCPPPISLSACVTCLLYLSPPSLMPIRACRLSTLLIWNYVYLRKLWEHKQLNLNQTGLVFFCATLKCPVNFVKKGFLSS